MSTRARTLSLLAALLAGSAALALSARAGDSATSKTFADRNFRLTVPSAEWKFEDVTEDNKKDGFVTVVRRHVSKGVEASAWVRVVDSSGAELDSLMAQVKEGKAKNFENPTENKMETVVWAGVAATLATVKGKFSNGSVGLFQVYGAVVERQFHELDVRTVNGADEAIPKEIEALVDGYRFLKGGPAGQDAAGGGDAPAGMDEPAMDEPGMDGGDNPAGPPAAPEDPLKRVFPNAGLSWSFPKPADDPEKPRWAWGTEGKSTLSRTDTGVLAVAVLVLPDTSKPMHMVLTIEPTPPGATALNYASTPGNWERYFKDFTGPPTTKSDDEVKIGNFHGSAVSVTGKDLEDPPKPLQIRIYWATQKRSLYNLTAFFHEGAEKTYKADFRAVMDGLKWDDASDGLRGPLAMPIPADTEPRGDFLNKEIDSKVTKAHGFFITKPPGFSLLKIDGTQKEAQYADHQVLWFAAEARTPRSYAFLAVSSYAAKDMMDQRPPKDPASLVDDVETEWKPLFTDAVTRPKSDKTNRAPGALNGAQGSTYLFKGSIRGIPYVEYGWVVKAAQYYYLVRQQYAGKDAEAELGAGMKTMIKSLKYE